MTCAYADYSGQPNTYRLWADDSGTTIHIPRRVWGQVKLGLNNLAKDQFGIHEATEYAYTEDNEISGLKMTIPTSLNRQEKNDFKSQARALLLFHLYPRKFGFDVDPDM